MSQPNNNLSEDDYFQLMHFTKMMASTVPVMEDNEDIRQLVHDYVINVVDNALELRVERTEDDKPRIVNIDNKCYFGRFSNERKCIMTDYNRIMREIEEKQKKDKVDMVNSPPHYNEAGIECIDAIAAALGDGFEFYLQGNVIKYLWRYRYKNGTRRFKQSRMVLKKISARSRGLYDDKS